MKNEQINAAVDNAFDAAIRQAVKAAFAEALTKD